MSKKNKLILENKNIKTIFLVNCILLVVACLPLPYGLYPFIRTVICLLTSLVIYNYVKKDKSFDQILILGLIAILFNPIFPVYLNNKFIWIIIDLGLGYYFYRLYKNVK